MDYGLGSDPQEWVDLVSGEGSASIGENMEFSAELQLSDIPPVVLEEAKFSEDILERLEREYTICNSSCFCNRRRWQRVRDAKNIFLCIEIVA